MAQLSNLKADPASGSYPKHRDPSPQNTSPRDPSPQDASASPTPERLRIAFFADTLYAPIGGGVVAARNVVERLREHHDVAVVGADAVGPHDAKLAGFQLPFEAMRRSQFVMARPDRRVISRVLAEADVVHLQFPFWLSFVALEEARRRGLPVVAGFHVQPENALYNVGVRSPQMNRAIYRFWVDRLYGGADAVVCPSRFAERKLRQHGLQSPTFVVSNGVPPDLDADGVEREPRHDGRFLVLMAGRFAVEKRQELLIEAVRRSKYADKIDVVIAGAGPREHELQRLAATLPNGAEVGLLPRDRLRRMFRTADLFVHCSEVELEGIAVLEAMAAGLPVLVAQGPESAASELALDERFGFPAGDAGALAAKLDALIERPEELARARSAYRAKTRELDFGDCVDHLVDVYRTVVARKARTAAPWAPLPPGHAPLGQPA
jgi:glycosyltransferase involved in cell wall biosynthesis